MVGKSRAAVIDCLQYCNYSEEIFRDLRAGGVDAIHTTISYHEDFRETVDNIGQWNHWFETYPDLIFAGRTAADVRRAQEESRTAVSFGLQNCSPMEDDIGLVEVLHTLGVRFMQLSYNNQSLLATGCYEANDPGITRMGREVIAEMNRVGMVIDMSHSATRSTLEAIELSQRPIAVTHANLHETGGMLGFSLYPHHLRDGGDCRLDSFCAMVARAADIMGVGNLGIGSDLCQNQPDEVVQWMRRGKWTKEPQTERVVFPRQPQWFRSNRDFGNIAAGLAAVGFSQADIDAVMGENWLRFFERSFAPRVIVDAPIAMPLAAQGRG
jgi:microsomal dipeptidase-like Zn-dependent dipeptidase